MCQCVQEFQCLSWFSLWKNPLKLYLEGSDQVPTKNGWKILCSTDAFGAVKTFVCSSCPLSNYFTYSDEITQFILNLKILIDCQFWIPPFVFWEEDNHLKFGNLRASCIISTSHSILCLSLSLPVLCTFIHTPTYYTHVIIKFRIWAFMDTLWFHFSWFHLVAIYS